MISHDFLWSSSSHTMARNLVVVLLLNLFTYLVDANLADDQNITQVKTAQYDELYADAIYAYNLKDFCKSMKKFDQAIADYKHQKNVKLYCREKCYKKFQESLSQRHVQFLLADIELEYFRLTIYSRRCSQLCAYKYLGQRSHVSKLIENEFVTKRLYKFLHFAYYKVRCILKRICVILYMFR